MSNQTHAQPEAAAKAKAQAEVEAAAKTQQEADVQAAAKANAQAQPASPGPAPDDRPAAKIRYIADPTGGSTAVLD